jgi:hypothetical protein
VVGGIAPGLLEERRAGTRAVLGSDSGPEAVAMSGIDGVQARDIDAWAVRRRDAARRRRR